MMKKLLEYLIAIFVILFIAACSGTTPLAVSTSASPTPNPFETVTVNTTLDFERNEKIYTIVIETSHFILTHRNIYDSLTPPPEYPETPPDAKIYRAMIKEIKDQDSDGEQEYFVLLNECEDFDCQDYQSFIRVYKYNPDKDNYYIFDEFKTDPRKIDPQIVY